MQYFGVMVKIGEIGLPKLHLLHWSSEMDVVYRNADGRIDSGDDPTTLCKNLVNFGWSTNPD